MVQENGGVESSGAAWAMFHESETGLLLKGVWLDEVRQEGADGRSEWDEQSQSS